MPSLGRTAKLLMTIKRAAPYNSQMEKKILSKLKELDIRYKLETHAPVFTVAESAEMLRGRQSVKNLLLKEEKGEGLVFVIMRGEVRLDPKQLAQEVGLKKLQFAKPDALKRTLGVEPGSASLFCLMLDSSSAVKVVVDEFLLDSPEIGFHPFDNTKTIFMSGGGIKVFLEGLNRKYLTRKL